MFEFCLGDHVTILLLLSFILFLKKKVLLALVSPSVPRDLRDKRKSLLSANQVRPRLVKLLRQELLADVQESAAELLMRVVATSDDGSSISTGPSSDEFLAAPLTGPMPRISPTPNRTKSSVGLSPASSSSVASSGPAPSPAKTPMQPRKLQLSEESFDYSDFIALLSVTGPVAVQACSMLQVSLSQGGLPAAKAFRGQRGVERMVYLVLDLLEPVRVQADWSIRARKHALSTLQQVVQCDSGCCDCFLESFGAELSIIVLASDRINQDIAVSLLETIANKGSREQRLVEVLLGSVRPQNTVNRPSGFASSMSKARQELEACKGSPNDASRTLLALAAEGFDLRQCARVLHSRCFSCGLGCPGVEDLRTELLEERDERIRAQQSEARQQAEQQKLRVTLEAERERAATEARLAQEAAERSARIRSEAEQMRRKLLAEADVEAAKARAAALLELEVLSVQKRHELEREERFLNLREETQRRTQEMAGRINNLMQEVAELKGKERNYLDMIESQKELIAQLSKVSEQLYASETPVDQRKFSV